MQWVVGLAFGLFLSSAQAGWEVKVPQGLYKETVEDMRIKVLGGHVRLVREYNRRIWLINPAWKPLKIEKQPEGWGCSGIPTGEAEFPSDTNYEICRIYRDDAEFKNRGGAFSLSDTSRYQIRPLWLPNVHRQMLDNLDENADLSSRISGFRWEDRVTGDWIEYDPRGVMQRYGDRNDVVVRLQYNAAQQLIGVEDHYGRTVMIFEYDAEGRVITVKDVPEANDPLPQRTVQYTYASGVNLASVTDVRGDVTNYTYNSRLYLTSAKNAENETLTITYGSAGKVSSVVEHDGATTTYDYNYDKLKKIFAATITHPLTGAGRQRDELVYDADGKPLQSSIGGELRSKTSRDPVTRTTTTIDGLGRQTLSQEDSFGNVLRTVYPDGSETSATYSPVHGQMLEEVDELGVKTTYEYDSKGNLLKRVEAAGLPEARTTDYTWDSFGQLLTETIKGGVVALPNGQSMTVADAMLTSTYDAAGNRQSITDAEAHTSTLTYNRLGQVLTQTDARQHLWHKEYDAAGNLIREANPLEHATTYTYDKLNRLKTATDALTRTTSFQYDVRGNLTTTTNALNGVRERQYDSRGRLIKEFDENGKVQVTYGYGLNGLPATAIDGNGNVTNYIYDASLQLIAVQYPTYREIYQYDTRSRRTQTQQYLSETTVYIRQSGYDAKGQETSQLDHNQKVTTLEYDSLGRVIAITDPNLGVARHIFDSRNNVLALTDANGHSTTFAYDRNNRTLSETRPEGQVQYYVYGPTGLLTRFTDAKGNRRDYAYDSAGHRTDEYHQEPGASTPVRHTVYQYNAAGTLTGWQDNHQGPGRVPLSASYSPDELQRITQETVSYGSHAFTMHTAYYPNSRKQQLTYPDGYAVSYGYDDYQQLSQITLPEGGISHQQKRWNQPQLILFPGGSTQQRTYDPLLRLTEIVTNSPSQQEGYRLHNVYDPESNITQQSGTDGTVSYGYDALYRLTSAAQPAPLQNENYSYDSLGNRLTDSRRGGSQVWQYNGNNQLLQRFALSGESVTQAYDSNGSLTGTTSIASEPGLNQQYTYDAANRLSEVRSAESVLVARYQYDPFGRRISKMLFDAQGVNPVTTWYVYSPEGLLLEANSDGSTQAAYGWRPEEMWGTAAQFIRTRPVGASTTDSLITYYVQNDHLGTSQRVIDAGGAVVWARKAYAFGEMANLSVALIRNPLRFPGQYHDTETGTDYNYFRDYQPNTGRYVQTDPIGLAGGMNVYGYSLQRPVVVADPNGLLAFLLAGPLVVSGSGVSASTVTAVGTIISAGIVMSGIGSDTASTSPSVDVRSTRPGRCTWRRYQQLKKAKEDACGTRRSCSPADDCPIIQKKIGMIAECIRARMHIMNECFAGGDERHQGAPLQQEYASLENCHTILREKIKKCQCK
ncbi:MAG: hypothetical protein K0Q68_195 [Moraxellaceae bacterium]|jgi:RHS repeat-associated protein|nr:hypothetical protein [Moraxellaceae bacterium]